MEGAGALGWLCQQVRCGLLALAARCSCLAGPLCGFPASEPRTVRHGPFAPDCPGPSSVRVVRACWWKNAFLLMPSTSFLNFMVVSFLGGWEIGKSPCFSLKNYNWNGKNQEEVLMVKKSSEGGVYRRFVFALGGELDWTSLSPPFLS